jgi:uncharacterized protein YaaQ
VTIAAAEMQAIKRKLKQQYKELEKNKQLQQWLEEKANRYARVPSAVTVHSAAVFVWCL